VGDGFTTGFLDLVDDVAGLSISATEVVDDHFGTFIGESVGVRAANALSRTCDDDYASFTNTCHLENSYISR
jgi:hypothetical protein